MAGGRNGSRRSRAAEIAGRSSRFVRARMARLSSSTGQLSKMRPIRTASSELSAARMIGPEAAGPARIVLANRSDCVPRAGRLGRRRSPDSGSSLRDRHAAGRAGRRRATGLAARRRAASRRSTDRRPRRGRSGSPGEPGAEPGAAERDRGPAPRRRAGARISRAIARGGEHHVPGQGGSAPRGRRSQARPSPGSRPRRRRTTSRSGPPRFVRGDLLGGDAEIQLKAGEGRIERPPSGRSGVGGDAPEDRHPIDQRLDGRAGVPEDLQPERVERANSDPGAVGEAERGEGGVEALAELIGGSFVEGDRGNLVGARGARIDQPGDPGDERRRLAGSCGRHTQDRARRGGGASRWSGASLANRSTTDGWSVTCGVWNGPLTRRLRTR